LVTDRVWTINVHHQKNFIKISQIVAEIWHLPIATMMTVCHGIFENLIILTASKLWRTNTCYRTKFLQNRPNCFGDISIFFIFKMAAIRHFGFVGLIFGTIHNENLITVQNLVAIGLIVVIIQKFEYFARLAWKRLFPPLFGCFWGKNMGKWTGSEILSI